MVGINLEDEQRISLLLLFFGAFLLIFGLTSFVVRGRFFLTTAPLALLCGVALGPQGADLLWILPGTWKSASENDGDKEVLLWLTRFVLGVQILSSGVTLPSKLFIKPRMRKSLLVLLGPVMLSSSAVSGLLAKAIFPSVNWKEAFVIGACLGPTDPVLAASVVKGTFAERHVPPFIRDLLLCESGINDGAATPYLMIPLLLLTSHSPAKEYFLMTILRETIFGMAGGFALGSVARVCWDAAERRGWIDKESRLVWTIALAMFTTGLFNLLESNELLACYFCGTAMNWSGHLHRDDLNTHFSEGIDALLDVAVFTTLGTVLPWDLWHNHDTQVTLGKLVLYGISVLLIRRLPFVVGLQKFIPEIRSWREAGFVGWFGPMGIGALYYALESAEKAPEHSFLKQQLFTIVSWVVFLSTLVHGTTVPLFALGSAVNPSFHPRFLVQSVGLDVGEANQSEADEETSLLRQRAGDTEIGQPISRAEIDRILTGGHGDEESLDSRQEDALVGKGSGLKDWGRGRVTVFVEGNKLLICDEEGNVSIRRVTK